MTMNAIEFLKKEHEKVKKMLAEIALDSHRHETKKTLFDALCQDLIRHETMEESIWYPRLKSDEKMAEIIKHLVSEETEAAATINDIKKIKTPEEWEEKFLEFKNSVEHHASEEEHKLFPLVEKNVEKNELEKLGKEMQNFKNEYAESK